MTTKRIGAIALPACLCLLSGAAANAEDKPPERFIYSTYHYCDFSKQDRADELYMQSQKPANDAAVKDGTIAAYGWLAHNTGGKWRRVGARRLWDRAACTRPADGADRGAVHRSRLPARP